MTINISDALPLLETILKQQSDISSKLGQLTEMFSKEPEPVEIALLQILQPLDQHLRNMQETIQPN